MKKARSLPAWPSHMAKLREKVTGKSSKATTGVPPEQVQEMVRQEVARIMREQGRGGELYLSKTKSIHQPLQRPRRGGDPGFEQHSQGL